MEPDRSAHNTNPYEAPRAWPVFRRHGLATMIHFVLPFAVPFLCYHVYQPINNGWTVKKFGCGCPSLDGTCHFNANDFNTILWGGILLGCLSWWIPSATHVFPQKIRFAGCFFGTLAIIWICLKMWARCVWL